MYGSNFCIVTLYPLSFKSLPNEDATIPFPNEETTPPVTKIYFVPSIFVLIFPPEYILNLLFITNCSLSVIFLI